MTYAAKSEEYRLVIGRGAKGLSRLPQSERKLGRATPAKPTIQPSVIVRALKATNGAQEVIAEIPSLGTARSWLPVATFSVCQKTGTAA